MATLLVRARSGRGRVVRRKVRVAGYGSRAGVERCCGTHTARVRRYRAARAV